MRNFNDPVSLDPGPGSKKQCQIRDLRQKSPLGAKFHEDPEKFLRRTENTS